MKKTKKANQDFSALTVIKGAVISLAVMIAVALAACIILYMQDDPTALIDVTSLIVLLTSAAVSGYIISKRSPERRYLSVTLSSLLLCLLLYSVGMIATAGGATARVYLNYLCYIGVALLFAKLGSRSKKRRH